MIAIDQVLLSDEVVDARFVCELISCKGGCCVEGDSGAPLTDEEAQKLEEIYPQVAPSLDPRFRNIIETQGYYEEDDEFGKVTPTLDGGICVYAYYDEAGIVKCAIEKAWKEGKTDFQKPISCHLYPLRIQENPGYDLVNYVPRPDLCRPACRLGEALGVPVYQFLKGALIRKYGASFYEALDAVAQKMEAEGKRKY